MKNLCIGLVGIRILLICLIVLNVAIIFVLSSHNAERSGELSGGISENVAEIVVKDFDQKTDEEKEEVIFNIDAIVRQCAHMLEFSTLGALILLLLMTWRRNILFQLSVALGAVVLTAVVDEILQTFSEGRTAQFSDIVTDFCGAVISTCLILLIRRWIMRARARRSMCKKERVC